MYGQFVCEMPEEVDFQDKTYLGNGWCKWSQSGNWRDIWDAQEQALRINYTKNKIDKTSENQLCRMCGETEKHIIRAAYNMWM